MKNPDENFGLLVRVQVDNVNETGQVVGKNEVPIGLVGTSQVTKKMYLFNSF